MWKTILVLFLCLGLAFMGIFGTVKTKADLGDITLADWEDSSAGADSGTDNFINFTNTGDANYMEVSSGQAHNGVNSWKSETKPATPYEYQTAFWNLTQTYDYVSNISMAVFLYEGTGTGSTAMFINDTSNNNHIKMLFSTSGGAGNNYIRWYTDAGYQNLFLSGGYSNQWLHLYIEHEYNNIFNVTLTDQNDNEMYKDSLAGVYANNWDSDYMDHFYLRNNAPAGSPDHIHYFDDIIIKVTDEDYDCDNINYAYITSQYGSGFAPNVTRGTTMNYGVVVDGDQYARIYIYIYDSNNQLFYSKYIGEHIQEAGEDPVGYGFSVYYPSDCAQGTYTIYVQDYVFGPPSPYCDWYHENATYTVSDELSQDFYDKYYNESDYGLFAEFDTITQQKYYVGDDCRIVYFMPENTSASNIYEDYFYCIILVKGEFAIEGIYDYMYVLRGHLNTTIIDSSTFAPFTEADKYQLRVYNLSRYSVRSEDINYYLNESDLVYISDTLRVYSQFHDSDGDGYSDEEEEEAGTDPNNPNDYPGSDDTPILPSLDQPLGSIVGLIITIFCILSPMIVGGAIGKQTGVKVGDIPYIVYGLTGGLGLAISVILGLFPAWVPYFIIAIGIILIIFTFLYKRQTSGGE